MEIQKSQMNGWKAKLRKWTNPIRSVCPVRKGGLRMGFWGCPPFRMGRGQGPTKEMEKQQSERR